MSNCNNIMSQKEKNQQRKRENFSINIDSFRKENKVELEQKLPHNKKIIDWEMKGGEICTYS